MVPILQYVSLCNSSVASHITTCSLLTSPCAGSGAFAPSFESEHRVLRLSAKLFNVTPADLPPDVRAALTGWLGGAPAAVEGYMRPGCVLLNLHITLDSRCAARLHHPAGTERQCLHVCVHGVC
jgi:hypothetical protein